MNLQIQANNLVRILSAVCVIRRWVLSAQDEDEAIDQSNIMNDRTRHAQPQTSSWYSEANEDDLPEETLWSYTVTDILVQI